MFREVTMEEISDGRTYELNDMVKCDTGDCKDCHKCCTGMGSSVIIDPFDVWKLKNELKLGFEELLQKGYIELNMVDGLILPNLKMNEKDACSFLDENGRCSIHKARPGICRIFPLGRVYDEKGFKYFVQKGQCIKEKSLAKIKVKKWIDTDELAKNQEYVLKWHDFIRSVGDKMIRLRDSGRGEMLNDIAMYVLNEFFVKDFSMEMSDINYEESRDDNGGTFNTIYDIIVGRIEKAHDVLFK
ncbi:MAG: YkgJ family cysteine cluster protein [Lachnospiraceae bacterium]|nr:YkgJ family cysteine cluster protein [Lachnospiraceae bacterium]